MAAISQCSRFLWMFHCNKCNKTFNYLSFQKHKELFNKTLIAINGDAEEAAARLQSLRDTEEAARLQAYGSVVLFQATSVNVIPLGKI
jgi:septation ring formation regulator EzrA